VTHVAPPSAPPRAHACARCGTELARTALACPACAALVHAAELKALAARAESHEADGALVEARDAWRESLALLPSESRQHAAITARAAELDRRATELAPAAPRSRPRDGSWWKSAGAALVTLLLLVGGKLKLLLLGLTKVKTFASMFAFFGVYWTAFGWPLALGLVLSIYVHEMGHVAMLRRFGIGAGAPLFIPGVGAVVMLKEAITDPRKDAAVGLAGPVWGLGAGLAAWAAHAVTGAPVWLAIAQLTGFINLFNLTPVWQLDGARAFHALAAWQRWAAVAAIGAAYLASGHKLLLLVGLVAVWHAARRPAGPGDARALGTYALLVGTLAWLAALRPL
jgi:Zn-dependent protease